MLKRPVPGVFSVTRSGGLRVSSTFLVSTTSLDLDKYQLLGTSSPGSGTLRLYDWHCCHGMPWHNPGLLAEQIATLDLLSKGG
ncbi:MAG: hypothetical protein CM1200mP27_10880 [Chloroflexota bacterium]|nr:MAG: hypothetical protein CM1200mP27_10880 [Chloroflexota bacterium]